VIEDIGELGWGTTPVGTGLRESHGDRRGHDRSNYMKISHFRAAERLYLEGYRGRLGSETEL
jgi:hypothetical protein